MNELVCDRIENGIAVLIDEAGQCRSVPLSAFQIPPKEGDVFDDALVYDPVKTASRRDRAKDLLRKLSKKGKK